MTFICCHIQIQTSNVSSLCYLFSVFSSCSLHRSSVRVSTIPSHSQFRLIINRNMQGLFKIIYFAQAMVGNLQCVALHFSLNCNEILPRLQVYGDLAYCIAMLENPKTTPPPMNAMNERRAFSLISISNVYLVSVMCLNFR